MKEITMAFIVLQSVMLVGCDDRASDALDKAGYDLQSQKYWEQVAETDRQLQAASRHLEISKRQAARLDALLGKWEEQAARQDRILTEQERQLGIDASLADQKGDPGR